MTNKERVQKMAEKLGLIIGCWDNKMEEINQANIKKVLDNIEYENDTDVSINRRMHVVEIDIAEDEVDFNVLTKAQYIDRYGTERWE